MAGYSAELLAAFNKNVAGRARGDRGRKGRRTGQRLVADLRREDDFTAPRASVLMSVVMNHLIHHRAQLGVYLRMNDVAVPGMYGPRLMRIKCSVWPTPDFNILVLFRQRPCRRGCYPQRTQFRGSREHAAIRGSAVRLKRYSRRLEPAFSYVSWCWGAPVAGSSTKRSVVPSA